MTLKITEEGETALVGIRRFAAPPARLYAAHTEPALLSRWMTGPEGWSMPVCEFEARPGGKLAFTWAQGENSFAMAGRVLAVDPPHRIVHEELWDGTEGMPSTRVVTGFEADGSGTLMVIQMFYADAEARTQALSSGMAEGMELSYDRIDAL